MNEMEQAVREWLDNDPEHLEHVNVAAVAQALSTLNYTPADVNLSKNYDIVRDAVEAFDDREH